MRYTPIDEATLRTELDLRDWAFVSGALHRTFHCGTFRAAGTLAAAVAALADDIDHHPDIDVRYPDEVRIVTTTHATGGLTDYDLRLARAVNQLAAACQ